MPSSANLSLGPGRLYAVPVGTPEPTSLTAALSTTILAGEVGYTSEGSTVSYSLTSSPVEVAEELDPLYNKSTGRAGSVAFAMAENTVRNLTLAFNGGKVTVGTGGEVTYEPPAFGEEVRRMIVWVADDKSEIWVFRQTFQTGDVSTARRKGAEYATLPVEFAIEAPGGGVRPFKAIYAASRSGGVTASV